MEIFYAYQQPATKIYVEVDADWAGDAETRKSCDGGFLFLGEHLIEGYSARHQSICLPSGEAELHGVVNGAARALWLRNILREMGQDPSVVVATDSTAAKGMTARLGAGRVRHLEAKYLWIQDYVHSGQLKIVKISTAENRADMQTKPLDPQRHWDLLKRLPLRAPASTGRSLACGGLVLVNIVTTAAAEREVAQWTPRQVRTAALCIQPPAMAAFFFGAVAGGIGCLLVIYALRALRAVCGSRPSRDAGSQTEMKRIGLWWEESHVTLKSEARSRGLDSGLLKKELIRDIVTYEFCRCR